MQELHDEDFELIDVTEKTPLKEAIWYYNKVPALHVDVKKVILNKLKSYKDWYDIYKLSEPESMSFELSLKKLNKYIKNYKIALLLYEIEFNDKFLGKLLFEKICSLVPDEFELWYNIYQKSYYDKNIKKYSLKQCNKLAKTEDELEKVYSVVNIGTDAQLKVMESIMKIRKFREKKIELKRDDKPLSNTTFQEMKTKYNNTKFGSKKNDLALINSYFVADKDAKDDD